VQISKCKTLVAALISMGIICGCRKDGVPNTNDATAPTVTLQFKNENGKYVSEIDTDLFNRSKMLEVRSLLADPDGLQKVSLYVTSTMVTCNIDGTTVSGTMILPLPKPSEATYFAGKFLQTQSPLFLKIEGPFYCHSPNQMESGKSDGIIVNEHITIEARATNWSSNQAIATTSKSLVVKLP
jgi:hypothetical protein